MPARIGPVYDTTPAPPKADGQRQAFDQRVRQRASARRARPRSRGSVETSRREALRSEARPATGACPQPLAYGPRVDRGSDRGLDHDRALALDRDRGTMVLSSQLPRALALWPGPRGPRVDRAAVEGVPIGHVARRMDCGSSWTLLRITTVAVVDVGRAQVAARCAGGYHG
jgi:hypothetical protein